LLVFALTKKADFNRENIMKPFTIAAAFGLAAVTGCASLGSNAPGPEFNNTDRCIEQRAREEANRIFATDNHRGMVRIEPLMFREIVRDCTQENKAGPSYYQGEETIYVPRNGYNPH
jgi:hypothetical protein